MKKLYKITATGEREYYEVYNEAIVCAFSEDQARLTHPDGECYWNAELAKWQEPPGSFSTFDTSWVPPHMVKVLEIGDAHGFLKIGPVVTSFRNA